MKALLLLSYSHSAPILYIQPTAIGEYLDSNLIDEQWLLNNHLVVYSACCCYHKSLDSSIKEAHVSSDEESLAKLRKEREVIIRLKMFYKNHHLDFNNPLL